MITHYLQTAWRHYVRFKYSTVANVLCLAFGLTCFLCAYSVFAYFASAESGFANADQIYVVKTQIFKNKEKNISVAGIPHFMIKSLKTELPELKGLSLATNLLGLTPRSIIVNGKHFDGVRAVAADNAFFHLFDIPLIKGDRESILTSPQGVVLGKDTAIKLFGSVDVVGKQFVFDGNIAVVVTGVMDALPMPTHLAMLGDTGADGKNYLNMLVSWSVYRQLVKRDYAGLPSHPDDPSDILDFNLFPYAMAYMWMPAHGLTLNYLNTRLQDVARRTMQGRDLSFNGDQISYAVSAVPVNKALSIFADSTAMLLGLPLVTLLIIIGTIILIAAIVNYVNLYTTQVITCRKEMGMQRLLGATRMQVITQCMVETLIVSAAALLLALLLFQPLKAGISTVSFVEFNIAWMLGWRFALCMLALLLLISLLCALYPIMMVSNISPLDSLQLRLRKSSQRIITQLLVALQFTVAGAMLVLLVVIQQQRKEQEHLAIGSMQNPVVMIDNNLNQAGVNYTLLSNQLLQHLQIKGVAIANGRMWGTGFTIDQNTVASDASAAATRIQIDNRDVSSGFFNVMNISMLAGHDFDPHGDTRKIYHASDSTVPDQEDSSTTDIVVDRNFVSLLGAKSAAELIGKVIYGHGSIPQRLKIIGVVKNSYLGISGTHNQATIFFQGSTAETQSISGSLRGGTIIVRIAKNDVAGGLKAIDAVWKQLAPNVKLDREFASDLYTKSGNGLFNLLTIILSFLIILAMAIAIMGMVGMAMHTITRRTREISIRKSLGASSGDILKLLLSFFAKPVVIANILLAWPLGYLVSRAYLSLFPYRVTLTVWPFVISLLITIAIVCIAVGSQSVRAARRKPAEVLRYE